MDVATAIRKVIEFMSEYYDKGPPPGVLPPGFLGTSPSFTGRSVFQERAKRMDEERNKSVSGQNFLIFAQRIMPEAFNLLHNEHIKMLKETYGEFAAEHYREELRATQEKTDHLPDTDLGIQLNPLAGADTPMSMKSNPVARAIMQLGGGVEQSKQDGAFDKLDTKIEYVGKKIILPGEPRPMTFKEARDFLSRVEAEQEMTVMVNEEVNAFPLEGAYAFTLAMRHIYGWASPLPGSFFRAPPQIMTLEVGYRDFVQVIWGSFALPTIEGELQTGWTTTPDGRRIFAIRGNVKGKHQQEIKALADKTREIVLNQSIYRGKAIRLRTTEDGELNWDTPPTFLDLSKTDEREMVFNEDTMLMIETNLFMPIEKTALCRNLGVPLKRGVLLEGPYGTGKTLTAFVTALKATRAGWTFVMVDRVSALKEAIMFAREYAPAVVFAEDIDREVSGEERTVQIDDVLNTIDGIESKSSEIMVVLTTNHVETINKAMLRPGRLDAVISIDRPDAAAAEKLVRLYARSMLAHNEDITEAGQRLAGQIPAVIREVVERSKLYAIRHSTSMYVQEITGRDLVVAAEQMKRHLSLLEERDEVPTNAEKLYDAFGTMLADFIDGGSAGNGTGDAALSVSKDTRKKVNKVQNTLDEKVRLTMEHAHGHLVAIEDKVSEIGHVIGISGIPDEYGERTKKTGTTR